MTFGLDHKSLPNKQFLSEFRETFFLEILRSQRIACLIIFIVALFLSVLWTVLAIFFSEFINSKLSFKFPFYYLIVMLYGLVIYEFISFFILSYCLKIKKNIPLLFKYGNATIEISFVSVALLLVGSQVPIHDMVFSSPGFSLYLLFIIISALKLDGKLSIYTGFFAALSYLFCAYYLASIGTPKVENLYSSQVIVIGRAIPLIMAGLLVAFTAKELKKRIRISLDNLSRRNMILSIFGQYVSPVVVDKLIDRKASILDQNTSVFPESRHVCILFFDIRNFTAFADTHMPNEVVSMLNRIFEVCIQVVNQHNGFINKFLGDGFMAVFGAPIADEQDSFHALEAAFAILQKIDLMNQRGELPQIRVGIGLHAGIALTGSVGSEERKEYTVVGDVVNTAARIEQLNKDYHCQLIVSETIVPAISNEHLILSTHIVKIRGKKGEMKVHVLA